MTAAVRSDEACQAVLFSIEFEASKHRTAAASLFIMNHVGGPVPARGRNKDAPH
jgi:hypothetical protein